MNINMKKSYLNFLILLLAVAAPAFAQTQAEMTRQACEAYQSADGELNRAYQQVLSKRKSDAALLAALRNEQRIWLQLREARLKTEFPLAARESATARYGSVYPMCRCLILEKITRERIEYLRLMLVDSEGGSGDVCGDDVSQIGQTEIVQFDENRAVVSTIETIGQPLKITFVNPRSKRELAAFEFTGKDTEYYNPEDLDSFVSGYLRFKIIETEELPPPLVFAVASKPGGTNSAFWLKIFGEIDGEIKSLVSDKIETNLSGGIHIGELAGRGAGLAVWYYVIEGNDHKLDPLRYEVRFYPFDQSKRAFVKGPLLRTKNRYKSDREALAELGLSRFVNQLESIPGLRFRDDEED